LERSGVFLYYARQVCVKKLKFFIKIPIATVRKQHREKQIRKRGEPGAKPPIRE